MATLHWGKKLTKQGTRQKHGYTGLKCNTQKTRDIATKKNTKQGDLEIPAWNVVHKNPGAAKTIFDWPREWIRTLRSNQKKTLVSRACALVHDVDLQIPGEPARKKKFQKNKLIIKNKIIKKTKKSKNVKNSKKFDASIGNLKQNSDYTGRVCKTGGKNDGGS